MGQAEPGDLGLRPSPQGEEGPPSLEYIQAKDLFPPKELVKEEENLQVRKSWGPRVGRAPCLVKKHPLFPPPTQISPRASSVGALASCSLVSGGRGACLYVHYGAFGPREGKAAFLYSCCLVLLPWRELLSCLGPAFPEEILQIRGWRGDGGVTDFWTEGPSASRQVPFTVLQGEGVEFLGRAADALIAISNYRLHIKFKDSVINVSFCLVLPHPSQNPCEIQGGIAPMLYLIMFPKSCGSLLFLIILLLTAGLSFCLSHLIFPSPLLSFPHSVAGPSRGTVALLEECHLPCDLGQSPS